MKIVMITAGIVAAILIAIWAVGVLGGLIAGFRSKDEDRHE